MYDVVIIGSGLGGLVSGAILSRNGLRVAVLEKHHTIGGCLQTFVRDGVKFETGMHYIGSLREGEILGRFFRYLGLDRDVELSELDRNCYDMISIGGSRYPWANSSERFVESLSRQFPDQRHNLKQYVDLVAKVAASSPLYSFANFDKVALLDPSYVKQSVNETIDSLIDNASLREVLAGNLPLYAGVKDVTPLYVHALIWDFYNRSAFRVVGGSDAIARSLARSIERNGGELFVNAEAQQIECNSERATAVRCSDGRRFEARYVISDAHPAVTVSMLSTPLIRRVYSERIRSMQQTVSNFTLYIKFREGAMPYMNHNFFHYRHSVWGCENYEVGQWPENFLYMHQCCEPNQRYARNAIVIAYMRWDEVARWSDTRVGQRGEGYEQFKQRRAEILLAELERELPGTLAAVERWWCSTPLTYRDYTGTVEGSMYGIVRDKSAPSQSLVAHRTKVPNLFFTGQNTNSHGILGVSIGSVITCSELLGMDTIIDQIKQAQ